MSATRDLVQQHRAQQLLLRKATLAEMQRLWPALDFDRLDATYPAFAVQVAKTVQQNRKTSIGLTAGYLRRFRKAAGVPGVFAPVLTDPLVVEQFNTSLTVTSVVALKTSTANGIARDLALANALTQYSGAMTRLVLNGGRETFTKTLQADPVAIGWARVLGGGGCDFCRLLVGRGAVYGAESVDFQAHDRCACTGQPEYR